MKYSNHVRIVLIPGSFETLSKNKSLINENLDYSLVNFGSNLSVQLQRTFEDDNELKRFIIMEFAAINYINPRKISEVIILTLDDFYSEALLNHIDFNFYFLTYCEVKKNILKPIKITFDREDFIKHIKYYDLVTTQLIPFVDDNDDDLPF